MLPIARKFFIASLIYLILGLLAQTVNVFDVWLGFNPLAYTAMSAAQQMFLLGWLTQLGLALVYDRWPLTDGRLAGLIFGLFNLGLPLTLLGQPGLALWGGPWLGGIAAGGGLLQLLAGLLFVREVWRVRGRRQ